MVICKRKKQTARWLLSLIAMLIVLFVAVPVPAEKLLVVDMAGSFSGSETAQIEQEARQLGERYAMDVVIVTTDHAQGKTARAFADDFFDEQGYGVGADDSGILFLIDYDNREVYISTSGQAIRYLTDLRIDAILDAVAPRLTADDPYGATQAFLAATARYLAAGIPSDQYTEEETVPNRLTLTEALIGFLLSGTVSLIFFTSTRRSYRGKAQQPVFEFRKNSLANLGIVQDQLVKTYVTTRIRPTQTHHRPGSGSSAGRSTVHRSSGGRTHGGGGRKF